MANQVPSTLYCNHPAFSIPTITSTIAAYLADNRSYAISKVFNYSQSAVLNDLFSQTKTISYRELTSFLVALTDLPREEIASLRKTLKNIEKLDLSDCDIDDSYLTELS